MWCTGGLRRFTRADDDVVTRVFTRTHARTYLTRVSTPGASANVKVCDVNREPSVLVLTHGVGHNSDERLLKTLRVQR